MDTTELEQLRFGGSLMRHAGRAGSHVLRHADAYSTLANTGVGIACTFANCGGLQQLQEEQELEQLGFGGLIRGAVRGGTRVAKHVGKHHEAYGTLAQTGAGIYC